jgi:ferredoxin
MELKSEQCLRSGPWVATAVPDRSGDKNHFQINKMKLSARARPVRRSCRYCNKPDTFERRRQGSARKMAGKSGGTRLATWRASTGTKERKMPNVTFSSPLLHKDVTVYAVAGDTKTILAVAEANKIPIPFECKDGECGSCLVEVITLTGKSMGSMLTDKEKSLLKSLGKISAEEIEKAEVDDIMPRWRSACQFIVRDQDILVKFSGAPGGA